MSEQPQELPVPGPPVCQSREVAAISTGDVEAVKGNRRQRALRAFGLAAVGAIPWVGGFLTALYGLASKSGDERADDLQSQWLEQHAQKFDDLSATLTAIAQRLEGFDDEVDERLESPAFLELVEKAFRTWDSAATQEKRECVRRLLTNAAASALSSDDLLRLFIDWLNRYDDIHLRIVQMVYENPGITRRAIWTAIHGGYCRDDSPEADLFKMLIGDLSFGRVIRQVRDKTPGGQYLKKSQRGIRRPPAPTRTMKSAFDDSEPYETTELGRQFVHYVMDEVAPQIVAAP
jgi:hypothetical protein